MVAVVSVSVPSLLAGQTALWLGTIGTDTALMESVRRDGSTIRGTILNVAAGLVLQRYEADVAPDGDIVEFRSWTEGSRTGPVTPGAPPTTIVRISSDSIRLLRHVGDSTRTMAVPAIPGAVPLYDAFFTNPLGIVEHALVRALARGDSTLTIWFIGSTEVATFPLTIAPSGEIAFPYAMAAVYPMLAGATLRARVSDQRLMVFDARETTFKIRSERFPWRDAGEYLERFRRQEVVQGGMGWMSPPTSALAMIGPVEVAVRYGQPSKRGRTIFPDVVPFGQVWRAGANAATEIRFSADVMIEGIRISAGSYSVWVLPTPASDTLILNSATRIWGVSHDPATDIARIPMRRRMLDRPIERLVYVIGDDNGIGTLSLAWGDRWMSVTIRPAQEP
jgi:hypothetical protein